MSEVDNKLVHRQETDTLYFLCLHILLMTLTKRFAGMLQYILGNLDCSC